MPTKWVVTTAADHIDLDDALHGEAAFTVTNPNARPDRAVFEVVPGDGAQPDWFSVEEPQRRVPGNGSVAYLVKVALTPAVAAGSYTLQARVYSADSAPEEDSVLSGRLALEKKPAPVPIAKKKPWWLLAVAALVVIVLGVVGWLVFSGGSPAPAVTVQMVTVPDLANQSQAQATTNLSAFGLKVGTVRHKQDTAAPDKVLYQSVAGGASLAKGSAVDLVVTVNISAPTLVAPAINATVPRALLVAPTTPVPVTPTGTSPSASASPSPSGSASAPAAPKGVLQWAQTETYPTRWRVTVQASVCTYAQIFLQLSCGFANPSVVIVSATSYTPIMIFQPVQGPVPNYFFQNGPVQWSVSALDDFGNAGTSSPVFAFTAG